MSNEKTYITITGLKYYAGSESFNPGMILKMKKDRKNQYDDEAIAVYAIRGGKYGYVANSVHTVCRGSHSAGYVYNLFEDETYCRVMFICEDLVIAEMIGDDVDE